MKTRGTFIPPASVQSCLYLDNQRIITDKPCLVVYSAISLVLIIAFFYSFILEKERNLFRPEDPDGRRCGYGDA